MLTNNLIILIILSTLISLILFIIGFNIWVKQNFILIGKGLDINKVKNKKQLARESGLYCIMIGFLILGIPIIYIYIDSLTIWLIFLISVVSIIWLTHISKKYSIK